VDSYIDDLEEEGGMDMYDEHEGDLSREQIVPSAHGDAYSSGLSIQGSVFPETLQVAADSVQRWINDTPSFFQAPLPSATASSSFSSNTSTAPSAGLTVDAHRKSASCVRWSPVSNGLFLSSGRDGSVAIWMLREGSDLPQQLAREEMGNGQIAFLHVEHHATQPLFSPAAADGKFRLYDLRKRGAATTVYGHAEATNCVMFFPNADHAVATASDDQSVKLWDIRALKQPLCAYHFSSALNRFDVSPSGHLAVATDRRRCTIVSPQGTVIAHLEDEQRGHVMPVMASRWTPDGSAVITAGFDGMCLHWSLD
jgi:WD40 repeat protein